MKLFPTLVCLVGLALVLNLACSVRSQNAAGELPGIWQFENPRTGETLMTLEFTARMGCKEHSPNLILGANGLSLGNGGSYTYKDNVLSINYENPRRLEPDQMLIGKVTWDKEGKTF